MKRSNRSRQSRHHCSEQQSSTQRRWSIITSTLLLLALAVPASAQQWHYVFGDDNSLQDGKRNVTPVYGLCTSQQYGGVPGYIAVGSDDSRNGVNDVYVVRTNNNGSTAWERTYDIGSNNLEDYGASIIELADGSGFAITGTTETASGDFDAFILKIDCQGNIVWSNTYGTIGDDEYGHDIIETVSGNPLQLPIPTSPGDLVVCGSAEIVTGVSVDFDALIFRTTSTGVQIWDVVYNLANPQSILYDEHTVSLIEATPFGGAATGDIVAVGSVGFHAADRVDGLVIRASGDDGTLGNTAVQSVARFDAKQTANFCNPTEPFLNTGDEMFEAVIELQNPNERDGAGVPNIVMVGHTTARSNSDIYAVKIHGGDPCDPAPVERIIRDNGPLATNCEPDDAAYDVVEVEWEMASSEIAQWDLVLTGYSENNVPNTSGTGNSDDDVILLSIDPATLLPTLGGISMFYGRQFDSTSDEIGFSLNTVLGLNGRTEGFIICGVNLSDPLTVGDPSDLYLIKTDGTGSASSLGYCEASALWLDEEPSGAVCESATTLSRVSETERTSRRRIREWDDEICLVGPKRVTPHDPGRERADLLSFLHTCNTLQANEPLALTSIENAHGTLRIRIVDSRGNVVLETSETGTTRSLSIDLAGVPSGVYVLTVSDDRSIATSRFAILR